jgi:hypothetical protein
MSNDDLERWQGFLFTVSRGLLTGVLGGFGQ